MRAAFTSQRQCCASCGDAGPVLRQHWVNFRVSACVGFDASHSAHVPDTGVIIYKAHTHGATCS